MALFVFLFLGFNLSAQQATWIWYPGDYEIWLSNNMQNRRTDRGSFFPVFWKIDSHYPLMDFHREFTLSQPEVVAIYAEGQYNVKLDGQLIEGTPQSVTVPAGKHRINVKVFNQAAVPAIYVKGGDYTAETLDPEEVAALRKVGAEVRTLRLVPGKSTSAIIQRMKN